ncbi:PTS-dependent dihydroxyacetone kinase phosphotransferase subunit DhaM [Thermaerobacter sp. FW80]|uniref:dihydroxyacetone kinase phosphoryl donor subunit DhaM n=1 Tax=Thermaerobacter sp. FW80 TaxID=2546351 RepID=UPI001074F36C|nr:dihydroxyacetone kinase phosphoryl donor subunit DhaM [Thermaerobacter sp. FW80]QBS38295.1 PTS-dependent dihydroxyacetone kinase phosphotransferase subunit DhaM [Thermaerobacter sp. FW80]
MTAGREARGPSPGPGGQGGSASGAGAGSPTPTALVLVSHSRRLAEGVRELAAQMAGPAVPILVVGGLDDGTLGTDATRILAVLEEALRRAAGVVVLVDLGSAYLNAVTALELLAEDRRARVHVADAPLVEGAVLAAVAASVGEAAATVRQRAEEARGMRKVPE